MRLLMHAYYLHVFSSQIDVQISTLQFLLQKKLRWAVSGHTGAKMLFAFPHL